jgi:iron complex outermembrane receptor protein
VLVFEQGNPSDKFAASVNWTMQRFGATLRATRYGKALNPGTTPANDFVLDPKTLVDLEARYDVTDHVQLAVGADNVFDEYPDPFTTGRDGTVNLNSTGNTPYSNYSPFGFTGRYLYGRVSVSF